MATDADGSDFTKKFHEVLRTEYQTILRRRRKATEYARRDKEAGTSPRMRAVGPNEKDDSATPEENAGRPKDLFGIALSGGGIRSASFCLGALQALDQENLVSRADYLSTVSGGGYIGASMTAAMRNNGGRFPFRLGDKQKDDEEDIRDTEPVNHIRDHSRFLAPNGLRDLLISVAIIFRGLVVNLLLLLTVLFPLATLIVLLNPAREHLARNIVLDLVEYVRPWLPFADEWLGTVRPYLRDPFLMTKVVGAALGAWLVAWALRRSIVEAFDSRRASRLVEQTSRGATFGRTLLIALAVTFVVELQPPILNWALGVLQAPPVTLQGAGTIGTLMAAVVAATASFRGTLVAWIQKALNSPTLGTRLQALFARVAFLAAGIALPLLIYFVFLALCVWGIEVRTCSGPACVADALPYPFTPRILAIDWSLLNVILVSLIVASLVVRWVVIWCYGKESNRLWDFLTAVIHNRQGLLYVLVAGFALTFLLAAAVATRNQPLAFGFDGGEWTVLVRYLLFSLLIVVVAWNFTENANGLNRLYRDRLNFAFRLHKDDRQPLKLAELNDRSPYILVNGTLNVRNKRGGASDFEVIDDASDPYGGIASLTKVPKDSNPKADPLAERRVDPARRGRNAEFFLFSRHFVGSDATGYVSSQEIQPVEPQLDLATAVAISGAAVSSSMGRVSIGLLGPTLALLNLRLGFWMSNPLYVAKPPLAGPPPARPAREPSRSLEDILRLYLFAEAFGRLSAGSSRIYITDGGHIDNIGLYQLLKRRCRFIVVVDGEADPAMNFGAFCDVQRFIRIDEGVRITLDWHTVRDAALARGADRKKEVPKDAPVHDRHFAVGRIRYADATDGVLLYVKASVTGDEPDYVLDYERRYPLFPHESTGDQFFSEEQMEAYRALGWHAAMRALKSRAKPEMPGQASADEMAEGPLQEMLRTLREAASTAAPPSS